MDNLGDTKKYISEKVSRFINNYGDLLQKAKKYRKQQTKSISYIYESHKKINMYLSEVRIMIITANEIERETLFAYFCENSQHRIVKIAKENIVYSFFYIGNNKVVHIEPANIGAYAHGGAADAIQESVEIVNPNIIVSVGVAYGANFKNNEIGDVLVGRQHFSYDKATKISNGTIGIKKLHLEEPDDYMLSRFKSNVLTEDKKIGIFGNKFSVVFGNMVTGEFVVDSIEIRNMIFSPFEPFGIIGGEMEAYGIFEAIKKCEDTHCILMKGICDWGAGKNETVNISQNGGESEKKQNNKKENKKYNPKNDFQTLAMFNACQICEELLIREEMFSDLKIKGFKKGFWRTSFGKIIKYRITKVKF